MGVALPSVDLTSWSAEAVKGHLVGHPLSREVEPVGRRFHCYSKDVHRGHVLRDDESDVSDEDDGELSVKHDITDDAEAFLKLDMYAQLGIGHIGLLASTEQIRKAYHKCLIKYHPDKTGRGDTDPIFLAIQEAYNTLGDAQKRRAYDSKFDFDESIPSGNEPISQNGAKDGQDFYQLYAPVFERNARFSVVKPVPTLGDERTPMEKVQAFYDFWHKFESWRDFSLDAEHDLDSAEHREERRWMQKQNENAIKKKKKKEYQRVLNLVSRAQSADPRIRQAREEERLAKLKAKEEKAKAEAEAAQREAEQERLRQEEEEARLKREKEEAQQRKLEKHKYKKELRKIRNQIRSHLTDSVSKDDELTADNIEYLCSALEKSEGRNILSLLDDDATFSKGVEAAKSEIRRLKAQENASRLAEEEEIKKRQEEEEAAAKAKAKTVEWTEKEVTMLTKCIAKFPGGTRSRWQRIADYLAQHAPSKETKTKEDCISKMQELQVVQAKQELGSKDAGAAAGEADAAEEVWTADEQSMLEKALKKYPASMEKAERWKAIAAAVPGKTKKQCIERFKEIRKAVLAAKGQK